MKFIIFISILIFALASLVTPIYSNHGFDKNHLIDDELFIDHDSLSVAQIQAFLDDNGSLLANWVDNVDMRRPSDNCVVHKATGMTAAEVIYEASTAWNAQIVENCSGSNISYWGDPDYSNYTMPTVSPKVILVTLQKEQSLISANGTYSTDPNAYKNPPCCASNEYKLARATGYGVPDSGSINEQYLGFYNQINWASWQFRYNFERSAGNTDWDEVGYKTFTGPFIEGTWKRCAACSPEQFDGYYTIDGSPLYMDNQATASLYYYTPHTYPGFFGNYNFVNFYENWFGTTHIDGSWQLISQHSYTDSSMSQSRSIQDLVPGDRVFLKFIAKNTGNTTWKNTGSGAIWAGTEGPKDRDSAFCDSTWINCRRPARMKEASVSPGQNATFEFWYNVPHTMKPGSTPERFNLLSAGVVWFPDVSMNFFSIVEPPQFTWQLVSQHAYTDSSKLTPRSIKNLKRGDRVYLSFVAQNNSNLTWRNSGAGAVWAGTEGPKDRDSDFCDSTWLNCRRPARMVESVVTPSQNATFDFWYEVPTDQSFGTYPERFNIVLAGVSWLEDYGMNFYTVVQP